MNNKSENQLLLNKLHKPYTNCKACPLSNQGRQNVVFGEGNPETNLLFIGEGPGAQEDLQQRPFVGRSGQLLTKVLETAGIKREEIYITNIVKCRPPGNRNPLPLEVTTCMNLLLLNQIAIIKPKIICPLGACAMRTILDKTMPISKVRGKTFKRGNITILPTFHPAYILRNRSKLPTFYNDIKLAIDLSGQTSI